MNKNNRILKKLISFVMILVIMVVHPGTAFSADTDDELLAGESVTTEETDIITEVEPEAQAVLDESDDPAESEPAPVEEESFSLEESVSSEEQIPEAVDLPLDLDIPEDATVVEEDAVETTIEEISEFDNFRSMEPTDGGVNSEEDVSDAEVPELIDDELITLEAEGRTWQITVQYEPETEIPADARLSVSEIKDTSRLYEQYSAQTEDLLEDHEELAYARFFDITILDQNGQELQPAEGTSVQVTVNLSDAEEEPLQAVHFEDNKEEPQIIPAEITDTTDGQEIAFDAEGFSVYGFFYTVDFHYEVDGKTYDFSIPGGSFTTLQQVVKELGIDTSYRKADGEIVELGIQEFVGKVVDVSFSNPELVSVCKAEEDTTIGAIKERLGLVCEYSAELTEEAIAEINSSFVTAGDWVLISLKAFSSDEKLTVRLVNGDEFEIRVTDAATADTRVTLKYIKPNDSTSTFAYKPSNTDIIIPENTYKASAKVENQTLMKALVLYTTDGKAKSNSDPTIIQAGYDGNLLVTNNTWKSSPDGGDSFVGFIVDNKVYNCAGDTAANNSHYESNEIYKNITKFGFDVDTTLIGIFKPKNTYFVYYTTDGNGNISGGNTTDFLTWNYASDGTGAIATPNPGYEFDHWEYNRTNYTDETFDLSNVSTDGVVKAIFKELPYVSITYQVDTEENYRNNNYVLPIGGSSEFQSFTEKVYLGGSAIGATVHVRPSGSWKCYGWTDEAGRFVSFDEVFIPTGDLIKTTTYKASFGSADRILFEVDDDEHGVIYRGGNQTGKMFGYSVSDDGNIVVANNYEMEARSKDGYEFDHWELNGIELEEKINPINTIHASVDQSKNVQVMVAFFRPKDSHKVTYVADEGGSVSNEGSEYVGGSASAPEGSTATPYSNYVFKGWYSGDNLFSKNVTLTEDELSGLTEDTVLTAKFYPPITIHYNTEKIDSDANVGSVTTIHEEIPFGHAAAGSTAKNATSNSKFVYWKDSEGNIVSYNAEFKPEGGQIKDTTYTAVFVKAYGNPLWLANDTSLVQIISRQSGGKTTGDNFLNKRTGGYTLNAFHSSDENYISSETDPEFIRWEVMYSDGTSVVVAENSINSNSYKQDGKELVAIRVDVKPKGSYIVNYTVQTGDVVGDTSGGNISNTTDYARSDSAIGCTAIKNNASNREFLGWFLVEDDNSLGQRISTEETITPAMLSQWVSEGTISEDFTEIRAYFGSGYTITYSKKLGDDDKTSWDSEFVTSGDPVGKIANTETGYNFTGWYIGTEKIADHPQLTAADLSTYTVAREDLEITAVYDKARVANYKVEYEGKITEIEGVEISKYGTVNVSGTIVDSESSVATQNADTNNILQNAVTAVAAKGCEFVEWIITDNEGNTVEIEGVDTSNPNLSAQLNIGLDVTFTAKFKKKDGAIEIVYTIQQEQDRKTYGIRLSVGDKTAEGTTANTAYLSEVVSSDDGAIGCVATGITLDNFSFQVMGWVLGKNGDPNKDRLISSFSTFVPSGEYLEDINGTGYRFFRAIPKWSQNTYIQLRVSVAEAGDFYTGSKVYTDNLVFVNNRTRREKTEGEGTDSSKPYIDSSGTEWDNGGASDAYKTELAKYPLQVNDGYKCIGFTYNGKELILKTPIFYTGSNTTINDSIAIEPVTLTSKREYTDDGDGNKTYNTVTVSTLLDYVYHSSVFRDVDGEIETSLNVLVANFEMVGAYNIAYHIKTGEGELSNTADAFKETERDSVKLKGSTVSPDYDNYWVFDHWEWYNPEIEEYEIVSYEIQFTPNTADITNLGITYHYYAVLEQRPRLIIRYVVENTEYGEVLLGQETVFKEKDAVGSTAVAYTGFEFENWTRDSEIVSDAATFIPKLKDSDFPEIGVEKTITFVAHMKGQTSLTINKIVAKQDGELDISKLNHDIYITLTDSDGKDILNSKKEVWSERIIIRNGDVIKTAEFKGLPHGVYNVWECYKDDNDYKKLYVGYLIDAEGTDGDFMLYNVSGSNNADLSGENETAVVTFTNTYSSPKATIDFVVNKKWQNSNNSAPDGAVIEFSLYSKKGNNVTFIKSITLDGEVDENGETSGWTATFSGLQPLPDGYTYAVRETKGVDGYAAYYNNAVMTDNTYVENSNGTITNRSDEEEVLPSPTSIRFNLKPFLFMLFAGVGLLAILRRRKRGDVD